MVERTRQRAFDAGLTNISCQLRDGLADGLGVATGSRDACLLSNILHCEEPVRLLTEAARTVRPVGSVLVIHWRYDPATPRGPALEIRPRPEQILAWSAQTGVLDARVPVLDLPPWHYGLRLPRRAVERSRGLKNRKAGFSSRGGVGTVDPCTRCIVGLRRSSSPCCFGAAAGWRTR